MELMLNLFWASEPYHITDSHEYKPKEGKISKVAA